MESRALGIAVLVGITAAPLSAQTTWARVPTISSQSGHGMVWDLAGQRVILVSGTPNAGSTVAGPATTWEWTGKDWQQLNASGTLPARQGFGLAYDANRRRAVLFGGLRGPRELNDTWEWDGTTWTQRNPAASPPARTGRAMAFDAVRGKVVLFGGAGINGDLGDTWEWDGTNWAQHRPAVAPPPRRGHHLAFDPVRGRTVLFGGWVANRPSADTWEWDGTSWRMLTPATAPSARVDHWMSYDPLRQRTVLFGGSRLLTYLDDLWEWDGTSWTPVSASGRPAARSQHAMAVDPTRGELVVYGGEVGVVSNASTLTWEWNGVRWRSAGVHTPPGRVSARVTYDSARDRVVMFGGIGSIETWEWDGAGWSRPMPATAPPPRIGSTAMAYQQRRARTLLFGAGPGNGSNDTWEWDGTSWVRPTTIAWPPRRSGHAMTYDPARDRVVLFGGGDLLEVYRDTWEWDGSNWLQQQPERAPPPSNDCAMVYDPVHGAVLLYLGFGAGAGQTWSWDGTAWTRRVTATQPDVTLGGTLMVHDISRGRIVLAGDQAATWEWVGDDWARRGPGPGAQLYNGLAYHAGSGRSVGLSYSGETWEYSATNPARATLFGQGCVGQLGPPLLTARSLPWLGNPLALRLDNLAAGTAALWLGSSDSSWRGLSLPFDLGVAGMPGCQLLAAPELIVGLPVASGSASWAATPTDPALVGQTLYAQGASADPGANATGVVVSNGLSLLFGAK